MNAKTTISVRFHKMAMVGVWAHIDDCNRTTPSAAYIINTRTHNGMDDRERERGKLN